MHVKIANIGHKLRLVQIVADVGTKHRQNEVIDPDAPFLPADMAPLLVLCCKRAIETRRDAVVELHFSTELHRHRFGTRIPLQSRDAARGDRSWHPPSVDPKNHADRVPS